jgi:hypothetical protein
MKLIKTLSTHRFCVALLAATMLLSLSRRIVAQQISVKSGIAYTAYKPQTTDRVVNRSDYLQKLQGFWLGECIANWTGLVTEGVKKSGPFFTDKGWGTNQGRNKQLIDFVLVQADKPWGSDDDTDIEYIYQHLLTQHQVSVLSSEQIRSGWIEHIKQEEPNYLWVSNEKAFHLMLQGMSPPQTSLPQNNPFYDQIDAQLTTEIFGLFAPSRPDVALRMAHLPIRTSAYRDAQWIAEFYVIMHSLASSVDPKLPMPDQIMWLADSARRRLPNDSFPAKMFDFVKQDYLANPDRDDWERTRDQLYRRHTGQTTDGYNYRSWFDAGINFGASLVSLFYGDGDFRRTIQIGTLAGWDSDNPTATWGGLLGFMLGRSGVENAFSETKLSNLYQISRTRNNFRDYTPDLPGEDTFEWMAQRGVQIIDRVVVEEMGGGINLQRDAWYIPESKLLIEPAVIDEESK